MTNFRTLNSAIEFYRRAQQLQLKRHIKDQLDRASLSIALNLAEGQARRTVKDQQRFFNIAFASLREVQAIFYILGLTDSEEGKLLNSVAAQLYKLIQNAG